MTDNHRALQLALADLQRAYQTIVSLEQRLAAQSGWAEDETEATIRENERERIVKALEVIWGYEPIATSHPTCMATCYDGMWIQKSTAIAIVRGGV
jgi:hypothetical protein